MSIRVSTAAALVFAVLSFAPDAHAAIPASERNALIAFYNATGGGNWTNKTNWLGAVCAIQHQEGSLAEVVSGIEYEQARRLAVPGAQIVFNGPMKTRDEATGGRVSKYS